jgi:alkanesulfonate monooxygenase SsuD/methylene tetrahydromethanopterin reductase-like flavin-dependent oxidoreductase (luciferase family)
VSVTRSVIPLAGDLDVAYFGARAQRDGTDQIGHLEGAVARFGKSYIGAPDEVAAALARDAAVQAADTLLVTVPNQLGVEYNTHLLASIAEHVAPAIGWTPATA